MAKQYRVHFKCKSTGDTGSTTWTKPSQEEVEEAAHALNMIFPSFDHWVEEEE